MSTTEKLPPVFGLSFGNKVDVQPIINTNQTLLSALTLDTSQFSVSATQGTVIGTIQGITIGSMLVLSNSNGGAVQLGQPNGVLEVGPTPPIGANSFNIEITEILSGAPPNATTLLINEVSIQIPTIITLPIISGPVQVGQTLTASTGTWANSPTSFAYQWNNDGLPIIGAIAPIYVLASADAGHIITVSVTAFNSLGSSFAATSAATTSVIDVIPTINTAASIPGTPSVGFPISAIDATWNNSVTATFYQWQVAGVNATGSGSNTLTYTPVIGDLGSTLTIVVKALNSGGFGLSSTSAPSAAVINVAPIANSTTYILLLAA